VLDPATNGRRPPAAKPEKVALSALSIVTYDSIDPHRLTVPNMPSVEGV
jgi:hypothetical protein